MKKAIAMKCTQEDWDSIKDRIPEEIKTQIRSFDKNNVLVNNWEGMGIVSNCCPEHSRILKSEYFSTFNSKIFLDACGIETDVYEITKETVIKYNMKDEFPDVFKTELVVGVWYKSETKHGLFKNMFKTDDGINIYGFINGAWFESDDICKVTKINLSEATPQEVEDALICEAKKRGYKNGDYKSLFSVTRNVNEKYYFLDENSLYQGDRDYNYCNYNKIFEDGIWATVIQPEKMTLEQIEKELGRKIELV